MTVLGGGAAGAVKLWAYIRQHPAFAVDPSSLNFGRCATCIKREPMLENLRRQLSALPSPVSIFKNDLARAVAHELRACPWVLEVTRIERRLPNELSAEIEFRKPAAMVQYSGSRYLIDRDGHWLPRRLYRIPADWDRTHMPVLTDRKLDSPPPVARRWGGPRLAAGARLVQFLQEKDLFQSVRITTIDVTEADREMGAGIVLKTIGGTEIWWGSSQYAAQVPGLKSMPHEPSDSTKLKNLCEVPQKYPGLQGLKRVDLRWCNKVYLRLEKQGPRRTAQAPN